MKTYRFTITLVDSGLPYNTKEEAEKDAKDWAQGIGDSERCMVAEVKVEEEEEE